MRGLRTLKLLQCAATAAAAAASITKQMGPPCTLMKGTHTPHAKLHTCASARTCCTDALLPAAVSCFMRSLPSSADAWLRSADSAVTTCACRLYARPTCREAGGAGGAPTFKLAARLDGRWQQALLHAKGSREWRGAVGDWVR